MTETVTKKTSPKTIGVSLVTSRSEKKQFIDFPYAHYREDEHWIPPLKMEQKKLIDTDENAFYENGNIALFMAEKDGEICGRIAAIQDHRYNRYHDNMTGFFGFFECIDDEGVAKLLFKVASDWLSERGHTDILGPANPSMMDVIGVLVDGFEYDPSFLMPYSKPYYDRLLKSVGLEKAMDMYTYRVPASTPFLERLYKADQIVKRRYPRLRMREIDLKNIEEEIEIIRQIFNEAWKDNWGFIPLTKAELQATAKDFKMILDTRFAKIIEIDEVPIAFSIAIPDLNQALKHLDGTLFPFGIFKLLWHKRNIDRHRTVLMGVLPEYQGKGIDALFHKESILNCREIGFKSSEVGWILETNMPMIRVAERVGGKLEKTYRMYSKELY